MDVVPLLLLAFGLVSVPKPEWMMPIHRRQKAAGTTHHPDDIEPSEGVYALNYVAGLFCILFGLVFTLRSL